MTLQKYIFFLLACCFTTVHAVQGQEQTYNSDEIKKNSQFLSAFNPSLYGDIDDALDAMESYAQNHTRDAVAQYQLARFKVKLERYDESLEHIQKAIRLNRTNKWYLILEADILKNLNRYNEAAQVYEKLQNLDTDEFSYPMDRAYCLFRSGNVEDALETLNNLEQERGVREEISQKKILILETMRRDEEVIKEYEKLIEIFPEEVNYLTRLAQFYDSRGDYEKAREFYQEVLKHDPTNSTANYALINLQSSSETSVKQSADQVLSTIKDKSISEDEKLRSLVPFLQDMKPSNKEQVENLVKWSTQLIEEYPKSAKSNAFLGDVYYYSGNITKAESAYKTSLSHTKSVYQVWEKYLESQFVTADYDMLYKVAQDAMIYFPNKAQLYIYFAYAADKIGKGKQAISLLMNAEMMAGNNVLLKQDIMALKLKLLYNEKQLSILMNKLNESKYISPHTVIFLTEIAEDNNLSIKPIRDVSEKKLLEYPDKENAEYALAMLYYKEKNYKTAQKHILKAQKFSSGVKPQINQLHGNILEKLGKESEAADLFLLAKNQGYKTK